MTPEQIPQDVALRVFLAMVAGQEQDGFFEIRAKRTTGPGMLQDWIPLGDFERAGRSLVNRGQVADAYVGVALRAERKGGLAAISRSWCLWADCDGDESLRRLARFRPLPSIVVRSGSDGHGHAYWPLRHAVAPEWAKRANRRLALALGADRNATDAARIMRAPLTRNHKHEPPRPVVCTRLELAVFELGEVVGHLPDDPACLPPPRRVQAGPRPVESSTLAGLARTVREAAVGNRNASVYWAACRLAEHDLDTDEARETLRDAALAAGLPEHEVDRTLASALDQRAAA